MKIFNKWLARFTLLPAVSAIFTCGCATTSSFQPVTKMSPVVFPFPFGELPYPLDVPNDMENNGVLLRYKPTEGDLRYRDLHISYMNIVGDLGQRYTNRYDSIVSVRALDTHTLQTKKNGYLNQVTQTKMTSRGAVEYEEGPSLHAKLSGYGCEAVFPQEAIKVGDEWSYQSKTRSVINNMVTSFKTIDDTTVRTHYVRAIGFATVGKARCVVLESTFTLEPDPGIGHGTHTIMPRIEYFDYARGIMVAETMHIFSQTSSQQTKNQFITKLIE